MEDFLNKLKRQGGTDKIDEIVDKVEQPLRQQAQSGKIKRM